MLDAVITLVSLAGVFGLLLGFTALKFKVEGDPVIDQIDALLPQTQCGQCTYPGCRPYATAIANGEADINQCPPGGEVTIVALSDLLGVEAKPLNDDHGTHEDIPTVVIVQEDICIGCTLCIQACPVDAIIGGAKQIHTVIEKECTGCNLCIPPCPVDCIDIIPRPTAAAVWHPPIPAGPVSGSNAA